MSYMWSGRDRRQAHRFPVGFYSSLLVDDEPLRCFATSLSATGLYAEKLLAAAERRRDTVQVEIPLPGTGDALWSRAEVVYDSFSHLFHGTAVRFTAMAQGHRRLLREWLHEVAAPGNLPGEVIQADAGVEILRPAPLRQARHEPVRTRFVA